MDGDWVSQEDISGLALAAIKGWGLQGPAPVMLNLAPRQKLRAIELACEVELALKELLPHARIRVTLVGSAALQVARS